MLVFQCPIFNPGLAKRTATWLKILRNIRSPTKCKLNLCPLHVFVYSSNFSYNQLIISLHLLQALILQKEHWIPFRKISVYSFKLNASRFFFEVVKLLEIGLKTLAAHVLRETFQCCLPRWIMTLIHSEIILTHMVCNFIPIKFCTTLVSADIVEGLTFEQKEVKTHV